MLITHYCIAESTRYKKLFNITVVYKTYDIYNMIEFTSMQTIEQIKSFLVDGIEVDYKTLGDILNAIKT